MSPISATRQGFYRETAASHMAFAALCIGRSPGRALRPERILELGFGQGFGLTVHAAANPDVAFEGQDFNPEHVAHAQRLIQGAGLANLAISEISFEEALARGGENNVDVIVLHGIMSWVGRPAQDAIIGIIRQRLRPNGIVYVSYNCIPGWGPIAPVRQLMLEVKRRNAGQSQRQLALALELINKLAQGNAGYFAANPVAKQQVEQMQKLDRNYLAHEYLDENWDIFQSSEMAARMSESKLTYVASATLLENIDSYAVQPQLRELVAQADPIMRETLRDYCGNRRFRRDLFARGSALPTPAEHRAMLSELSFALTLPRHRVSLKFAGPLTELTGTEKTHAAVADLLAEKKIASFEELVALPVFGGNRGMVLDCLCLLVDSLQVVPIIASAGIDRAPAQRFNRMIVDLARTGRVYPNLASPVARTGIPVGHLDLLALAAVFDGKADDAGTAAQHALSILKVLGFRPIDAGVLIQDDGEAITFLTKTIGRTLEEQVPIWQRLGIL